MFALPLAVIIVFLLWSYDISMIFTTIFWSRSKMEAWLDRSIPVWSRQIIGCMGLWAGKPYHLPRIRKGQVPDHFILICNHQSLIDILALFYMFPDHPIRFVGKNSLRIGTPGVSRALRLGRHAFVKQSGDPVGAVNAVRAFSRRCVRLGKCPVIFPEGTRSKDGTLGDFKTGGFRTIADGTHLPIVLVAIDGGWRMGNMKLISKNGPSPYNARLLKVYPAAEGKSAVASTLADANLRVAEQLSAWRKG